MIITVAREFGSGGRELGKRIADYLGIPCYDKEIINEVAKAKGVNPEYVKSISEADIHSIYASTVGRSLISPVYFNQTAIDVLNSQQQVIKNLAQKGDCVIIGRSADVLLEDLKPFKMFVYADENAKLNRCLKHIKEGETEKSILKHMKEIDKNRAKNYGLLSDGKWGTKENYHLCVNTTNRDIKSITPLIAEYIKLFFVGEER